MGLALVMGHITQGRTCAQQDGFCGLYQTNLEGEEQFQDQLSPTPLTVANLEGY